jgi:hypothetical protein
VPPLDYGFTVSTVEPETDPEVAFIVVDPAFKSVAVTGLLPLVMVATVLSDDVHVTEAVTSCVPPPIRLAVAVNCSVPLDKDTDGLVGVTTIDCMLASATVTVVVLLTVPEAAVMVAVPADTAVTKPPALIVATLVGLDDQLTVTGPWVPSLKVPVAVICTVHTDPGGGGHVAIVGVCGAMAIATNVGSTKNPLQPASSSNATMAKRTHNRLDRPRLAIPTTSEKESYQT